MAEKKENGSSSSMTSKQDTVVRTIKEQAGKVLDGAAEVAAITGLGKVAEAYGRTEAASDEQLTATDKGYFDVLGRIAEKAETKEERDAIREDAKQARQESHDNAKEKSEARVKVFAQIAGAILVVAGVVGVGFKAFARRG